jgi:choline monooxygenase
MLNIYEGQMQTNVVIPVDVNHTIVRFDWFSLRPLPDFENDARWCELARLSEEVQAEDAGICEIVQRNIGSRAYVPGPYSPKRESGVHLFHTLMNAWG